MPVPRLIDADTYLRIWTDGFRAHATGAPNPYDKKDEAGEWRAWIRGHQAAVLARPSHDDPQ